MAPRPEADEAQRQAVPVRLQQPGHERPARVIRSEQEARAHMREQAGRLGGLVEQAMQESALTRTVVTVRRAGGAAYRAFMPAVHRLEMLYEEVARIQPARAQSIAGEESAWLDAEYLGEPLHGRIVATPPYFSFVPREILEAMTDGYGSLWRGQYYPDTNHLLLHSYVHDEEELRLVIAHELLHYASWLGGGSMDYRWAGRDGQPLHRNVPWLDEGLTELHAQQLLRSRGFQPGSIAYAAETIAGFYLQQLAGADALRRAYLSGNFQEVASAVDSRLGSGSFERLAGFGRGAEALAFLEERLDAARIDRAAWDRDPLLSLARSRM
jgi:hypothetical protein